VLIPLQLPCQTRSPAAPRNPFASMKHTMPIMRSWKMDWPTSAMSGGFRPTAAEDARIMRGHITPQERRDTAV
jgi:hypothetical protein